MADNVEKKPAGRTGENEITFTCRFCGETRPLSDMVIMRQYFPQIPACKKCARGIRNNPETVSVADVEKRV